MSVDAPEPMRVLLVDDEPANLVALASVLRGSAYQVHVAGSGPEALAQVLRRDLDVIILDVRMPDMDGFETASMIRERPSSSRIPIVFTTASVEDVAEIYRRVRGGRVDYVHKPVDPDELRAKVADFVELARGRRARAADASTQVPAGVVSAIAHELYTALTPLVATVDALSRDVDAHRALSDSTLAGALERIGRAAEQLEAAVSEVLDSLREGRPPRPVAREPVEASSVEPPRRSQSGESAPILLVDDDPEIRAAVGDALAHEGYDVVVAENGEVALEQLARMPRPRMILVDLMMPVMDGEEFLSALRREPEYASVPAVVMSAGGTATPRVRERAQAFLRKPVRLGELVGLVEQMAPARGVEARP